MDSFERGGIVLGILAEVFDPLRTDTGPSLLLSEGCLDS